MKHATGLGTIGLATLLATTACGPSEEQQFLDAVGCHDGETAEDCGERLAEETLEEFEEEHDIDLSDTDNGTTAADSAYTGRTTGPAAAELGEPVDVDQGSFVGVGDYKGTITLEDIERPIDPSTCDDEEPQNGEFVALHIRLDADENNDTAWSVYSGDFYIIDENDTMLRDEINSYEAYVCGDRNGSLQHAQPGTNTSGIVMLDTDVTEGTLVYMDGVHDVMWNINPQGEPPIVDEPDTESAPAGGCRELLNEWGDLHDAWMNAPTGTAEERSRATAVTTIEETIDAEGCWET